MLTSDATANRLENATVEMSIFSGHGVESRRVTVIRHETDGGVRLAGGRAGEVVEDSFDRYSAVVSILPPPYSPQFEET